MARWSLVSTSARKLLLLLLPACTGADMTRQESTCCGWVCLQRKELLQHTVSQ